MDDEEIIAARRVYEDALWKAFGRTMRIADPAASRAAYNAETAPLRAALPDEVKNTLRPWQQ